MSPFFPCDYSLPRKYRTALGKCPRMWSLPLSIFLAVGLVMTIVTRLDFWTRSVPEVYEDCPDKAFPEGFVWGVATASYQVRTKVI